MCKHELVVSSNKKIIRYFTVVMGKNFSQQLFLLCINVSDSRHMCNTYECEIFQTTK